MLGHAAYIFVLMYRNESWNWAAKEPDSNRTLPRFVSLKVLQAHRSQLEDVIVRFLAVSCTATDAVNRG